MTEAQVRLQLRPPQIEVAIFQTQIFRGQRITGNVELKWERTRVVEDDDLAGLNFYLPRNQLSVARVLIAQHHFTNGSNYVFTANLFGFRVSIGSFLLIDDDLGDAFAVA